MDLISLGKRLREARENAGLSQLELAHLLGRDQRAISDYESGKRKLAAADLPHFAQVLHVPIFFFFEEQPSYDDLDYAILDELHKLPTYETRQAALQVIRSFTIAIQSLL